MIPYFPYRDQTSNINIKFGCLIDVEFLNEYTGILKQYHDSY